MSKFTETQLESVFIELLGQEGIPHVLGNTIARQQNEVLIKAELKVDLIILLAENDYSPITKDEVFKEIFEQAENFKKYNK